MEPSAFASRGALSDPDSLDPFLALAHAGDRD
jgi:hypothetical protein